MVINLMDYEPLTTPVTAMPEEFALDESFIFWALVRYSGSTLAAGAESRRLVRALPRWYRTVIELSRLLKEAGADISSPFSLKDAEVNVSLLNCLWALQEWIMHVDADKLIERSQQLLNIASESSQPVFLVSMLFGPYASDFKLLENAIKGNPNLRYLLADPLVKYLLSLVDRKRPTEEPTFHGAWQPRYLECFNEVFPPALNPMLFKPLKAIQLREPAAFKELDEALTKFIDARKDCNSFAEELKFPAAVFLNGRDPTKCLDALKDGPRPELIIWSRPENDCYARAIRRGEQVPELVLELNVEYSGPDAVQRCDLAVLAEVLLRYRDNYFTLRFDHQRLVWTCCPCTESRLIFSIPPYFAREQIQKHAIYLFYSFRSEPSYFK